MRQTNNNLIASGSKSTSSLLNKSGSLFGSTCLLCGSSIGVGILPLPVITGLAGSIPSVLVFFICCIYMTLTALLILESSLIIPNANFISLASHFLGEKGKKLVLLSFLFLFYSLTTAYLAKGGELINLGLHSKINSSFPMWYGSFMLALVSALLICLGPFIVDHLNRIFICGFILTYALLLRHGFDKFDTSKLMHQNWSLSLFILPFIITSFGYHNMVPLIGNYLNKDRTKSIKAFIWAGVILFFVYVIWILKLHSIIPVNGPISFSNSFQRGEIVTAPLNQLIQSSKITIIGIYMAFFAIITSILGQGLSVIDFLAEWLKVQTTVKNRVFLSLLLFIPTLLCSQLIPGVFFKALEFAGGVAALIIFGLVPTMLGWVRRYRNISTDVKIIVPGGKIMLISLATFATFIISYEILKNLHLI